MVESECRSPLQAIGVAVVFGVGLGASAALGVGLGWSEPYWVAEPILILLLYIIMGKRDRVRGKAIGTACGVAAAVAVAAIGPSTTVTSIIAAAAFLLALSQAKTYWLMYGLYTFALVLALSAPGQIGAEAEKRGVEILTGIGLLVIGLAIVHSLARWQAKRHPHPNSRSERALGAVLRDEASRGMGRRRARAARVREGITEGIKHGSTQRNAVTRKAHGYAKRHRPERPAGFC